jgi:hypothetical protein
MRWTGQLIACLCLVGCLSTDCSTNVQVESTSPDDKQVATLFTRKCGAGSDVAQVVSIRPAGSKFSGNKVNLEVFVIRGEHSIAVRWEGAKRLIIERPALDRQIFKELKSWNDVEVIAQTPSG